MDFRRSVLPSLIEGANPSPSFGAKDSAYIRFEKPQHENADCHGSVFSSCESGLMVEQQPSKLLVRVRFPSFTFEGFQYFPLDPCLFFLLLRDIL